jgi:hypothetical protein
MVPHRRCGQRPAVEYPDLHDSDVSGVRRPYAVNVSGYAHGGYHLSEDAPDELTRALLTFLRQGPQSP